MSLQTVKIPGNGYIPRAEILRRAELFVLGLTAGKLRLFKSGEDVVSAGLTLADLDARQCDFNGYPSNGAPIPNVAFVEPYQVGANKFAVTLPSVQFNCTGGTNNVLNEVEGAYIVNADGTAVLAIVEFPTAKVMNNELDSLIVSVTVEFE